MLADRVASLFQYNWSGRALASSGFVVVLEVALLRAILGSPDIPSFLASSQFAILLLAVLGFFAWSAYFRLVDRPAPTSNETVQMTGPPPADRHRGIVQGFSNQLGYGTISCTEEDEWPGSDSVHFYLADKERLGLQTDDVVAFHIMLDRQANDGSYRAVNIRYAHDDPPRRCMRHSTSQGQTDTKMCKDADHMRHLSATCTDKGATSQSDTSAQQPINAGLETIAHTLNAKSSTPEEKGAAGALDNHQGSRGCKDDEELEISRSIAEQVPSTRLGNSSSFATVLTSGLSVHAARPFDTGRVDPHFQELVAIRSRGCESDIASFLDIDVDGVNATARRFAPLRSVTSSCDANVKWPHREAEASFGQAHPLPDPVVVTMKNTFLHVEDSAKGSLCHSKMKRSASDSEISSSSHLSSSESLTALAVDKKTSSGSKVAGKIRWLPKSLASSSDSQSLADVRERSDAKQMPIPTKTNLHVKPTDDFSFWLPSQQSPQPMYVESCTSMEQGAPPLFLDSHDVRHSQRQGTSHNESFPAISKAGIPNAAIDLAWNQSTETSLVMQLHAEIGTPINDLKKLYSQGILQQIPRNDDGEFTTIGSIQHGIGECRPCVFWFRKSCAKGVHCTFCHFVHTGQKQKRIRPSKATRLRLRAEVAEAEIEDCESESELLSFPVSESPLRFRNSY